MSPRYLRNEPGPKENATAALLSGFLAAGVGLVVFYFARLFLARDTVIDGKEVAHGDGGSLDE
jgi:hypothetical protein